MEEKEIKSESSCGHKCMHFGRKHVICLLSVALVIMTISTISLALCREGRGFRHEGFGSGMMEDGYGRGYSRFDQGGRENIMPGQRLNQRDSSGINYKRGPNSTSSADIPVDIVPTNPVVTQ